MIAFSPLLYRQFFLKQTKSTQEIIPIEKKMCIMRTLSNNQKKKKLSKIYCSMIQNITLLMMIPKIRFYWSVNLRVFYALLTFDIAIITRKYVRRNSRFRFFFRIFNSVKHKMNKQHRNLWIEIYFYYIF